MPVLCILAVVWYIYTTSYPRIGTYGEERIYWDRQIALKGGAIASAEMTARYARLPLPQAHEYAHVFGSALYSAIGVEGFGSCTNAYLWGCQHSVIERAIADKGMSVITVLNEICLAMPRADIQECQHGLGHGILSLLGTEKLSQALNICSGLPHITWGCTSGVFMEYFNGNIHEARPPLAYTNATRYGPCPDVAEEFKAVCYRRLPNWWHVILYSRSADERLVLEQKNCTDISETLYRTACFIGVGYNEASFVDFNIAKSRAVCEALTHESDRTDCSYGEGLSAFQNTPSRERATQLCPAGVTLPECITYSERVMGADKTTMAFPQ